MLRSLQPWFLLARRRFYVSLAFALFLAIVTHMWVSADSATDFGIFYHHFCGCPVDPDDVRVLFNFPFDAAFIGFVFGIMATRPTANAGSANPATFTNTLFLLTRPVSRATVLLAPFAVATLAIATLPVGAMLLLLGWLRLVHAPSLGHLLATVQQIPEVAALGPHPTFGAILATTHFARRYTASIALGLCAYTLMASQRWLILSPNKYLKFLGIVPAFLFIFPVFRFLSRSAANFVFMTPGRGAPLNWQPSTLSITLHFAFAAATLAGCWQLLRSTEA
jgi:hypothetical protein